MISGLDPTRLEEKLWKWFRMAEEWQAVLLIDEADVYLEQRGIGGSLERDAIVAGKSNRTSSSSLADNRLMICQSSSAPSNTIAGSCSSHLIRLGGLMRRSSAAFRW